MFLVTLILSAIFFITGLARIKLKNETSDERTRIFPELPEYFKYIIIIFEITVGILIWTKYKKYVLYPLLVGLVLFTIFILSRKEQRNNVLSTYKDVFTYKSTLMSIGAHVLIMVLIIQILYKNS
jgi:uncharacterized membrane protein YphA (DoxX/SURF4 family)